MLKSCFGLSYTLSNIQRIITRSVIKIENFRKIERYHLGIMTQ